MTTHRLDRVSSLVAQIISEMILRQEIKDPRVSTLLSISEVDVSKDLGHAKIGVAGYVDHAELERGVEALNNAAGFIQSRLGKSMKTRLTPRLTFYVNHRIEEAFALTKTLEDLVRDQSAPGHDTDKEA